MQEEHHTPYEGRPWLSKVLGVSVAAIACGYLLQGPPALVSAESLGNVDPEETLDWVPGATKHAQVMRKHQDVDEGTQPTPGIIPTFELDDDPSGQIATYQPGGPTVTADNPSFQNLGTNERTCFTCHQPQTGWTVSAASVQARFAASFGADPIFRLVDGATCPTDNVKSPGNKRQAYKLLLEKGLIRIGLPMPANAQFEVVNVNDPYNCTTNPATGLTTPTTGIVSVYRRPLPSTSLGFLTTIMWDGREPSLAHQALDATNIHAQASGPLTSAQQDQIVAFESGVFTAQMFDNRAGDLKADGANGGPIPLSQELAKFFGGINDPVGLNPTHAPFDPNIFDLYTSPMWQGLQGREDDDKSSAAAEQRRSIAHGERVFNETQFIIADVPGLNDRFNLPPFAGFCGTCHDTPDVGNHSVPAPLNIGIANAGANSPPALDISGLPVFTLKCLSGPLAGQIFVVTDPGRALISGNCTDIGKVKGPILRGLAARAPYFHNGSAATLLDVVNFYDKRFVIGFTDQQKEDLINDDTPGRHHPTTHDRNSVQ
jgi:cytochrome c peroxidase